MFFPCQPIGFSLQHTIYFQISTHHSHFQRNALLAQIKSSFTQVGTLNSLSHHHPDRTLHNSTIFFLFCFSTV